MHILQLGRYYSLGASVNPQVKSFNLFPLAPALKAVSEPLGNIEKVVMIDHGGDGNGGGSDGLNRFAQTGPTMIYMLLQLQALGLNVPDMLKQLGTSNGEDGAKVAPQIKSKEEESAASS